MKKFNFHLTKQLKFNKYQVELDAQSCTDMTIYKWDITAIGILKFLPDISSSFMSFLTLCNCFCFSFSILSSFSFNNFSYIGRYSLQQQKHFLASFQTFCKTHKTTLISCSTGQCGDKQNMRSFPTPYLNFSTLYYSKGQVPSIAIFFIKDPQLQ